MASLAPSTGYEAARERLRTYFDSTAVEQWKALTSDAPVSRVRATVRAGRQQMRDLLLSWLPADLAGRRLLDAGCGTGALAVEAARRGATVVAVDVSPQLIDVARDRAPADVSVDWRVGDMLSSDLGHFDHVVAMDSLIHYEAPDLIVAVAALRRRVRHSLLFTFAPSTPMLELMHAVGGFFPRGDRAPAIAPIAEKRLRVAFGGGRTRRVQAGFYTSQAFEVLPDPEMPG
jgi:magnesium-protoporphyrin O-methyltransferase